ncbi:hypothetical protein AB0F17_44635 [Nonomuraea sp. NPDC026600]|uniref:hypothetical protein n=1 Tax=Nonomuraea sp. NPDC026600 TaxID=3155363 RepID=UPI0033D8D314
MKRRTAVRAALAVCATIGLTLAGPVADAAARSAPPVVRVSSQTGKDSAKAKSARARCPHGTRVISGGASIEGGTAGQAPNATAQVVLTRLEPVAHGSGHFFEAAAHEDGNGFGGQWRLKVYAVCGRLPGLVYLVQRGTPGSPPSDAQTVNCPAGKVALGTGGRIDGGDGKVFLTEVGLQDAFTFANAYEAEGGFAGRWRVTAFAVCGDQPPGYAVEMPAQVQGNSVSPKSTLVACPNPAQRIVGTGVGNGGQQNQVIPMAVFPSAALNEATTRAAEDETGLAGPWDTDQFLVCVD